MADHQPGTLDGLTGAAYADGVHVADVRISDERSQTEIEVPLVGQSPGRKPGRISGLLALEFGAPKTPELGEWLDRARRRERNAELVLRLELEGGIVLPRCGVGGYFGDNLFAFEELSDS